jgi:hypothetical protein
MSDAQRETPVIPRFDIREHRRPALPGYAYAGIVLAISQTIFLFISRLLAVIWNFEDELTAHLDVILFLAALLALGIVPAAASVGLGLAAMREGWRDNFRHSVLGAIALGSGCVYIVLWVSRMLNAGVASVGFNEYGTFATQIFWWA